jgi:hypothetical protein
MYVNAKMALVETILGMGESGGGDESKYDIFDTF